MMARDLTCYRVFIASPGGLEGERTVFSEIVEEYNLSCARKRGLVFEPVGWEVTLAGMGRPQELINEDVRSCDYFFLMLHDRWGTPTDSGGQPKYKSGSHEEYCVALDCYEAKDRLMRQLVLLFKGTDPSKLSDPGPQLQQVLAFRRQVEQEKRLLFCTFDDIRLFEKLVRRQLDQWVIDHEQGKAKEKVGPISPELPPLDADALDAHQESTSSIESVRNILAEAERLADAGRLIDSEIKFAEAIAEGNSIEALNGFGRYLLRVGRLGQAATVCRRVTELAELSNDQSWAATGYGNQGVILEKLGHFDKAEEMYLKSLMLNEQIGRSAGQADQYGNLASIFQSRGDLDAAENAYHKAIELDKRANREIGLAHHFTNIAQIYLSRKELDRAEEATREALAINERLGRKDGMAMAYGNLGVFLQERGEYDEAEAMYKSALATNELLGRKEGIAIQHGNIGSLAYLRGNNSSALENWQKSRDIFISIAMPHKAEEAQQWINDLLNETDRTDTAIDPG